MNNKLHQTSNRFWILGILAIIWNLVGVFAYLGQTFMSDEILKTLSKSEQNYFITIPAWVTAAFATAVFAGLFGSICLLFKKKIAFFLFLISFVALVLQHNYNIFIQEHMEIGGAQLILPFATTLIGVLLVWYTYKMGKKNILI
tara:strand:+ start:418 stop:849 length:432 start_codon:yes stop_codon:yes gene_type:complete